MNFFVMKFLNLIKRGKVTLAGTDTAPYSRAQITCMGKTKVVEIVSPYGLYSNLPKDSLIITFAVNGQEENTSAVGYSPLDRFKNLVEGEVLVGNPKTGAYVKFSADKKISVFANSDVDVQSGGKVSVTASGEVNVSAGGAANITASGDATLTCAKCTIAASGEIALGSGGMAVARLGDAVQVNIATGTGTIIAGSTKVKSA